MANPIIYTGNPGPISGSTPFGFYDNDVQFKADGPRVANYCALKLGYPVLEVELQDKNFYAAFKTLFPSMRKKYTNPRLKTITSR